jgi:hypothetical protein
MGIELFGEQSGPVEDELKGKFRPILSKSPGVRKQNSASRPAELAPR